MTVGPRIGSWPRAFRRHPRRTVVLAVGAALLLFLAVAGARFSHELSALRSQQATGPNWSFPSRVYSDDVPLVVGRDLSNDYLVDELRARGYVETRKPTGAPGTYARSGRGYSIVLRGSPDEADPRGRGGPECVAVRIRGGIVTGVDRLGGVAGARPPDLANPPRLEPVLVSTLFDEARTWRTYVPLERVPRSTREAILVAEDRRFLSHFGVDVFGAARALRVNMRRGEIRQGGSTITQQVARGLFLGRERTLVRKLAEIPLAMGLEAQLSKDEILEMYLNSVYWGQAQNCAIGGIAAAARWYFDAPVESLTVLQGATLAAMIPAPNLFDPFKAPKRVRARRNAILRALELAHHLPTGEGARLAEAPLGIHRGKAPSERFPSYTGYVNAALANALPRDAATHSGLSIFTTMDLAWQVAAEAEIATGLERLDPSQRQRLEGAFVALDPSRGAVLAMVGGRASATGHFNRAFQARRQTGSAIKPIVYAAALASGLTPAETVSDIQVTYTTEDGPWCPRNLDGKYHAQVTLAKALEKSLNVATTAVVERVGPRAIAEVGSRFGLAGLKPVLSIGLGSSEVSLLQLTNAYAVFPARGILRAASPLRFVVDRTGRRVAGPSAGASRAIPPDIAALMTGLLENVTRYGVAAGLRQAYGFQRPVAGKTGTTNDYHDAWFVGFTPTLVAGVWLGYDRPRSVGTHASDIALPLWAQVVGRLVRGSRAESFPSDTELDWVNMNPWHGCIASAGTRGEWTPFLRGTAPATMCAPQIFDPDTLDRATAFADSTHSVVEGTPPP